MIKKSELKSLRIKYHGKQDEICPILKLKVYVDDTVVDHKHKKHSFGASDSGLIRGVIHRGVNSLEGKISNAYIRYGLHKVGITLPDLLRNLADYLENPPLIKYNLIHPSEKPKPKPKVLTKTSYNKLQKKAGISIPSYNDGKIGRILLSWFTLYEVTPEYYK